MQLLILSIRKVSLFSVRTKPTRGCCRLLCSSGKAIFLLFFPFFRTTRTNGSLSHRHWSYHHAIPAIKSTFNHEMKAQQGAPVCCRSGCPCSAPPILLSCFSCLALHWDEHINNASADFCNTCIFFKIIITKLPFVIYILSHCLICAL